MPVDKKRVTQRDVANSNCADFAPLLEQMRPQLTRIARREVEQQWQSKQSASDIVQDTMIEAATDLPAFKGTTVAEFKKWLRMILKNNLQDARRKFVDADKRCVRREQEFGSKYGLVSKRSEKSPSSVVRGREFNSAMQRVIAELPVIDQQILQLRFQRTLTFAQIGEVVNMKSDTVRQRLPGILKILRARLRQFNSGESRTDARPD